MQSPVAAAGKYCTRREYSSVLSRPARQTREFLSRKYIPLLKRRLLLDRVMFATMHAGCLGVLSQFL